MRGKDAFFAELLALAESEGIRAFVVGLPLRSNGEDSETTRQARNMAARLARRTDLPVYLMPELLSSHEAESRLRQAGTVRATCGWWIWPPCPTCNSPTPKPWKTTTRRNRAQQRLWMKPD